MPRREREAQFRQKEQHMQRPWDTRNRGVTAAEKRKGVTQDKKHSLCWEGCAEPTQSPVFITRLGQGQ